MRILIVTQHVRDSHQAIPLAAGCIAAALPKQLRCNTRIINLFPGFDTTATARELLASEPDLVALSLSLWNREPMLGLARTLRALNPELYLVAGGPETAGDCRLLISQGHLNAVIHGEGEQAFAALTSTLANGEVPAVIPGLMTTDTRPASIGAAICPDLSVLPSPWLTGVLPLERGCGVLWEVARGCHFDCSFCYDAKGHQGVRPLPFERLRQELKLFSDTGVAQIWVLDSTFNAPPERGRTLLRLLLDVAPQIHYHIEAKADFLDSDTIELLSRLSCSVQIGLQSARPEILTPLRRRFNLKQTKQVLQRLNRAGIVFGLDLIYGLPGDDHDGFCRSLDFALQQQPNQVDIFPLAILPGTDLFQRQNEFGVCGMTQPPYLLTDNLSYPTEQREKSRRLAEATDIFYNRGRAVGFFRQLCEAASTPPATVLQQFYDSLITHGAPDRNRPVAIDSWTPDKILPLQLEFAAALLARAGRKKLIPVAEDLIRYHFLCAELLLAEDCPAAKKPPTFGVFAAGSWQLHPAVRVEFFHYAPEELECVGGHTLAAIAAGLEPNPGFRIFHKRNGELLIDFPDEPVARMLTAATTPQSGQTLLRYLDGRAARKWISIALSQGLLQTAGGPS